METSTLSPTKIVSREEWLAARKALPAKSKAKGSDPFCGRIGQEEGLTPFACDGLEGWPHARRGHSVHDST